MLSNTANAPAVTGQYAQCKVCGGKWQIRSFASPPTDAQGCPWCGAPKRAITVHDERNEPAT